VLPRSSVFDSGPASRRPRSTLSITALCSPSPRAWTRCGCGTPQTVVVDEAEGARSARRREPDGGFAWQVPFLFLTRSPGRVGKRRPRNTSEREMRCASDSRAPAAYGGETSFGRTRRCREARSRGGTRGLGRAQSPTERLPAGGEAIVDRAVRRSSRGPRAGSRARRAWRSPLARARTGDHPAPPGSPRPARRARLAG
jgi:hypothetical protein